MGMAKFGCKNHENI